MGLKTYRKKRDFERTPEPAGEVFRRAGWRFTIQKHAAHRLHYDFRLELDGVLKSWAVPKGPSLDPGVKRLAIEVEDHPVDYGDFEGIIPAGEYGGGTVLLWDTGAWEPDGDPHAGLREGKLKFRLHGQKLRGGWMLVKTHSRRSDSTGKGWLLFKERDDEAVSESEGDVLEEQPLSVASGRDLDEIASTEDRVWSSNQKQEGSRPTAASSKTAAKKTSAKASKTKSSRAQRKTPALPPGAKLGKLPTRFEPQLATLTQEPPDGDEWLHEVKFDGYRMLCRVDGDAVEFTSRNQHSWTSRLKPLVAAVSKLPVRQALFDGEVVALRDDGATDFQSLQSAFRDNRIGELKYYVFDLLFLDGHDLTRCSLEDRKRVLADVLSDSDPAGVIRLSEHIQGDGKKFLAEACRLRLEGMVSKRRDRPYRAGRSYDWLKIKCVQSEEFVIGGFTEPADARTGFGALLLGYYDQTEKLVYAGKVGTGFDRQTLDELHNRLKKIETSASPFSTREGLPRKPHWVKPSLVAQVTFGEWTHDGILRQASYQGLREDKDPKEVRLDQPVPIETAVSRSEPISSKPKTARRSRRKRSTKSRKGPKTTKSSEPTQELYDRQSETFAGVRLTNAERILYADAGLTKLDLATYYSDIADWILPHLEHRPLMLLRCPEGRSKKCFHQKHPRPGAPRELRQVPIREKGKEQPYLVVDDVSGLIALAQIGTLEIHTWGSREEHLEQPDRLIFDLDPDPELDWKIVVESARQIRDFLEELGLQSFVKTTGGKGLHLAIPVEPRHDWDEAQAFCKLVAELIVRGQPDRYTSNMSKAQRTNKIFIDYLRNCRGATSIAPYATRARPNATICTPLTWDELTPEVTSDHYTIGNIRRRLSALNNDPWKGFGSVRQSLARPIQRLESLS